jgi:hypothetical protein
MGPFAARETVAEISNPVLEIDTVPVLAVVHASGR